MVRGKKAKYILYIFLGILAVAGYLYIYKNYGIFKTPDEVRNFVLGYGHYSSLVYLALQIMQIIIFFIPGEIIQIAGGYIFGTLLGGALSILGIIIGSSLTYIIAHSLGRKFVHKILSKNNIWILEKLEALGEEEKDIKRLKGVVFFLYLIPGIPKDILGYICGISQITFKSFVLYSTLGRLPALIISLYFGEKLDLDNLPMLIVIAVVMSVLFIIGVFYGRRIIQDITRK
ncbi:TVP38/TMEM64 family protein [Alloiococcus sp. CFN-8]|uniref:TVP38/TMEM64 family protein n=1 Tax=Alloiococcus sp. CFN-8 TaxID=3416081 RepID=UPI003CEC4E0E